MSRLRSRLHPRGGGITRTYKERGGNTLKQHLQASIMANANEFFGDDDWQRMLDFLPLSPSNQNPLDNDVGDAYHDGTGFDPNLVDFDAWLDQECLAYEGLVEDDHHAETLSPPHFQTPRSPSGAGNAGTEPQPNPTLAKQPLPSQVMSQMEEMRSQ